MTLTVSTLALTCLALLAAGVAIFLILGRIPSLADTVHKVWPTVLTASLVIGIVAGLFWVGGWVLTIALLSLAARTGYEAASVVQHRQEFAHPAAIGGAIALFAAALSFLPMVLVAYGALGALAVLLLLKSVVATKARGVSAVALDLALFPTLPLVVFTAAGLNGGYGAWLLIAFILVETFDGYASLGGQIFGKHKAFPRLSPNKTIEGLAIGAVMLILTAAGLGAVIAGMPVLSTAAVALFAGVLTLLGDLVASHLKRKSGVKDYPQILPHQGGLLDITDSWITTGAGLVCLTVLLGIG